MFVPSFLPLFPLSVPQEQSVDSLLPSAPGPDVPLSTLPPSQPPSPCLSALPPPPLVPFIAIRLFGPCTCLVSPSSLSTFGAPFPQPCDLCLFVVPRVVVPRLPAAP